jgi:glycosyltransferase involved in cell wall biosynthesis
MKKTICFFSGDITRSGGTERVSTMIANALAAQGNYRIFFLSLVEQSEELFFELDQRIRHTALGKKWIHPGPGYLGIIPKLRRFLKQKKIDIIIDIDIVLDVLSIPAAHGLKTKIISWEHFNYDYEMESFYRRCILKYSVKRTDYIVTLTEGDSRAYRKNLNRKKNISAIYNPMQEFSKEILLDDILQREKCLITVGRLIPRKGMDYLAKVAVPVLKKHPDWKWLVVGDGEEQSFLEDVIEKNQLKEQLILTGRTDDVGQYLIRAQIYVMTSRIEGLPMCLLEAKTFYLPSVSFDIPTGPNEIIEDGVNGYLIEAFDCKDMVKKLEQLMENEMLRKQFSEHAQDNLAKFQMEHILEDWNWLLEKL